MDGSIPISIIFGPKVWEGFSLVRSMMLRGEMSSGEESEPEEEAESSSRKSEWWSSAEWMDAMVR